MPLRSVVTPFRFAALALVLASIIQPSMAQARHRHGELSRSAPTAMPALSALSGLSRPSVQRLDPELRAAIARAPKASQWPEENYASLLDTAEITVKPDGATVADYRSTYKLFNERARDLAEVSLPYNNSYQKLEVLYARTIKSNGAIMTVKPGDIRTQSPYSEYLMYDDSKAVGFSMPGIEDNCLVDYRWRLTTKPILAGRFSESWTFSQSYPVGLSRLILHAPANRPFRYRVYNDGKLKPSVSTSADRRTKTYTWEARDIPPLDQEPDMPELADVHSWMEISSIRDWQDMAQWYNGLVKSQAAPNRALRKTVLRLVAGRKTDEQKARALYDFVANNVRYVGLEFGISAFRPHSAVAVHEKLYGDCKDKATLLITMLDMVGIKAHPALLYADTGQLIRNRLPSLEAFNHCIAVADLGGKDVWLDATAETCAFGDIPDGDRGSDALVIKNGVGKFVVIPAFRDEENTVVSTNRITMRPDRSGQMDVEITFSGASAQEWRGYARSLTPEKRRQMMNRLVPIGGTLKTYSLPDGVSKSGPFVVKLSMEMPKIARKTGNLLLLGLPATSGSSNRNPYIHDTRRWPIVNRRTQCSRSTTTITLPEGYVVEEMPDSQKLSGPLSEYGYEARRSQDGKTVTVSVTRTTRSGSVPPADYVKMRSFYDKILEAAEDQMIVLRKAS